jgi:hypothetical protein
MARVMRRPISRSCRVWALVSGSKTRRRTSWTWPGAATHAHFHPGKTVYFDATLGWALPTNADVRNMWEQYMPQWPAGAKSYPTQILGDMTSAVVFVTDTPELFGGEIRTISIVDLQDGKIVRVVDYWDGRGFGAELAGSLRVPADSYPHDLGASTVTSRPGPVATAARQLTAAFAAGDTDRAGELFSYVRAVRRSGGLRPA